MVERNLGDHNPSFRNAADTLTMEPTLLVSADPDLGADSVETSNIEDNAITFAKMQDFTGPGFILRGGSAGAPEEVDASTTGQILVGSGSAIASVALSGDATLVAAGTLTIANSAVTNAKTADTAGAHALLVRKGAIVVYDFAVDGGATGTIALASAATIPNNAVCYLESVEVITTLTSSGDAATVSLDVGSDGALNEPYTIDAAVNPWDAGTYRLGEGAIPIGSASIAKSTSAGPCVLQVAGEALTAGKIIFNLGYYVSE